MRILQLCTDFPAGGIQRHVLDLGSGIRERGHHVAYAGTRGAWMNETVDPLFTHIDIFKVTKAGGSTLLRLLNAIKGGIALRRTLVKERIELFHQLALRAVVGPYTRSASPGPRRSAASRRRSSCSFASGWRCLSLAMAKCRTVLFRPRKMRIFSQGAASRNRANCPCKRVHCCPWRGCR